MTIYLLILAIFFLLFTFRNKNINILNLGMTYSVLWLGILLIYNLNIFSHFSPLSATFYVVFSLALIGFFIGERIGFSVSTKNSVVEYDNQKIYKLSKAILSIVISAFVLTIAKIGLPPLLGGQIPRAEYYVNYLELFYLLIYSFWFLNIYLIFKKYKLKRNLFLLLLSLSTAVMKENKAYFFVLLVTVIFFLGLNRKFKVKHLMYAVIGMLFVFFLVSFTYTSTNSLVVFYKIQQTGFSLSSQFRVLYDPLIYLTNNFLNLNNYLITTINVPHMYGLLQFEGFFHNIRLNTILQPYYDNFDNAFQTTLEYSWLTTSTYLKPIFADFGFIGTLVVPFIYGLIGGIMRKKVEKTKEFSSLPVLYIFFLFFFTVLWSFFTNYISNNEVIPNILVILIVSIYSRKRLATNG